MDHEDRILESARQLATMDFSEDPEAAREAAAALQFASAALQMMWAVKAVLDKERSR